MSIFNSVLQKTSSLKSVCILFVTSHLVFLSMMVFTFPVINNQIGNKAFDLQTLGYSVSTAESILNNLNAQTTDLYLFPQLTLLDISYPFLLALFLSSFLFRLFLLTKTKNKDGPQIKTNSEAFIPCLKLSHRELCGFAEIMVAHPSLSDFSWWFVTTNLALCTFCNSCCHLAEPMDASHYPRIKL